MARKRKLPLDIFEGVVERLDNDGYGIVLHGDRGVRVPGVIEDEKIRYQYLAKRRGHYEAQLVEVLKKSGKRVAAHCPYFLSCGGCKFQHLEIKSQLKYKHKKVGDLLARYKLVPNSWLSPVTARQYGYRNKARLGAKWLASKDTALVGFRKMVHRGVTEMDSCEILHPSVGRRLAKLRMLLSSLNCRADIPQMEVAIGDDHACIVIRHLSPLENIDKKRLKEFEQQNGIDLYLQSGGPDTLISLSPNPRLLRYSLPDFNLEFRFQPLDFTQVNPEVNRKLVARVVGLVAPEPNDVVGDLFCGIGNFSLPIARTVKQVIAVEGVSALVSKARDNARLNSIDNAKFYTVDLQDAAIMDSWFESRWNKVVIDPPRSGAEVVVEMLNTQNVEQIVYVSCNPVTLARDADILVNKGKYEFSCLGLVDMFPHTNHIECVALFKIGNVCKGANL